MPETPYRFSRANMEQDDDHGDVEERCPKRDKREDDSLNTSTSATPKKKKMDCESIPPSTSYWKRADAEKLGIFYNSKATDIADFFKLSKRSETFVYPLEIVSKELLDTLVTVTKEKLHKTEIFHSSVKDTSTQVLACLREVANCLEILSWLHNFAKYEEMDPENAPYLRRSHYRIEEFFMQLQKLYTRGSKRERLAEIDFTELLAAFTRVFLLNVETLVNKRTLKIGSTLVSSVPDLSIWAQVYPCFTAEVSVVTVAELKLEKMRQVKERDTFEIGMAVSNKALGQHAGELLFELSSSPFEDVALGFICMQTMIIFTYLEMSKNHLSLIEEKGEIECQMETAGSKSGIIFYTKPYDYMKENDRKEILEFLFWLGLHSLPVDYRPKGKDT